MPDKPIYIAMIDEVPTLSLEAHEVCDPQPCTSEQIVAMWGVLKTKYEDLHRAFKEEYDAHQRCIRRNLRLAKQQHTNN